MFKMDLKFIKTSNRSSFLIIKLLFSGFQISFPIFLNNLLCKNTSYCNCKQHLMYLCQECDIQHAQRYLARNHSGPTSVKSRKCRRNKKKSRCLHREISEKNRAQ